LSLIDFTLRAPFIDGLSVLVLRLVLILLSGLVDLTCDGPDEASPFASNSDNRLLLGFPFLHEPAVAAVQPLRCAALCSQMWARLGFINLML
jgi:hypothetical protein